MTVPITIFAILPQAISALQAALASGMHPQIQSALGALSHPDAAAELNSLPNAADVMTIAQRLASSERVDTQEAVELLHLLERGTGRGGTNRVEAPGPDAPSATKGSGIYGHSAPRQHRTERPAAERFPPIETEHMGTGGTPEVGSMRKCQLVVTEGPNREKKFTLAYGITKIGRDGPQTNDITITDDGVSREHCEIEYISETEGFLLRDLSSTNGTFLNGTKVKEAYLSLGDRVRIGRTILDFGAFDERVKIEPVAMEEFGEMVGKSVRMRQIFALVAKIAPSPATVMIEGETGTGKELVAKAIHNESPRKNKPFIVFDCSAVPPNLIESELFGHERGSFTGAVGQRRGAFELADGGTIFLDEIGELSAELQPKLLRVLEGREIRRVGGSQPIDINVRIVCATNKNLQKEVEKGRFRPDLYYRLNVVRVSLPPLRERPEDIPLLVKRFIERGGGFNRIPSGTFRIERIDDDALAMLMRHPWPGNVRELLNVLERAASFADGKTISGQLIASALAETALGVEKLKTPAATEARSFGIAKQRAIEEFERDYLTELMRRHNGNLSAASREARTDRKHLRSLLRKYRILPTAAE